MYDTLTAEELAYFAIMFPHRVGQQQTGILTDDDVRSLIATGRMAGSQYDG